MIEVLTTAEMVQSDAITIASGTPGLVLMQRAGRAVAERARAMSGSHGCRIVIIAGPGNNGGDGFTAAAELKRQGCDVTLASLGAIGTLRGDAARAANDWDGPVEQAKPAVFHGAHLIIDAIYGAGLNRKVEGAGADIIAAINASGVPVLSVDLPSGVNGDTGAVMGQAVNTTETVTFFRKKPGHLLLPGRVHCGPVHVADIGISPSVLAEIVPRTFENGPGLWRDVFPQPAIEGHKYARGHVLVASGGLASTGAARLAARGALRVGAGLVTVASPPDALAVNAAALTAVMVREADGAGGFSRLLADKRINVCVIGPGHGGGEPTRAVVMAAIKAGRALVLDADALTSFADDPAELFGLLKSATQPQAVLTPHSGESTKLFSGLMDHPRVRSKLELARLAASHTGSIVLLKGSDTVIASPDGRAAICANAPPWLATAGAGDVLAGFIGGLLAQGVPPFEAASTGAWLHGEAANEFGPGLIAEDLPEMLPRVLRKLQASLHCKSASL